MGAAGRALQGALDTARQRAVFLLRSAAQRDIRALPFGAANYPARLAAIADPPPVLWYRGAAPALDAPAVAIVGSRAGSPYAREVAFPAGVRPGVERYYGSERPGARRRRGRAPGCFGGGWTDHRGAGVAALTSSIRRNTAICFAPSRRPAPLPASLPPGEPPRAFHFPRRNRLISGLSLAVVVVEASERSGSLITARCAAEQGRDVMAVPGNVLAGRSRGAHALIRDGARIVESVDDILEEIRPGLRDALADGGGDVPEDDPLLRRMDRGESYDLDELGELTRLDQVTLASRVVELEMQGRIARLDSGRFSRS